MREIKILKYRKPSSGKSVKLKSEVVYSRYSLVNVNLNPVMFSLNVTRVHEYHGSRDYGAAIATLATSRLTRKGGYLKISKSALFTAT